jgi:LysR family transcriptional regulator, transcription activator of glutamate synthase operon
MELRQLRYFAAVARRRHFTAAAEAIGVAQPALSQQIRILERELGVQLFDRAGRRVRLTPAGEALLLRAERILAEVANAQSELAEYAGAVRGRVVVGTLPSLAEYQLPPLVAAFHARHPGLELVLREERTARLLELLGAGEVDLALLHHSPAATAATPALTLEPLFTEELVAAVGTNHPLADRAALALAALRDEAFILTKSGSAIRDTILAACAIAGFAPRIAFESGAAATVRALAAAGLGVAILPRSEAQTGTPPLASLELDPRLTRTVALAWPAARRHPPATAAFLALAREALRRG